MRKKEEEKKGDASSVSGNAVNEVNKEERKMFIFANTFEIMLEKLISEMNTYEIYPVFQVLEITVNHLSKRVFDHENASIDDYIMTIILRNQLSTILDFRTTSKVFGLVFGESIKSKHSIFEDEFNPQAAISLTKVYSSILMTCSKSSPRVF